MCMGQYTILQILKIYIHLMGAWLLNILIIRRNFSDLLKKGILVVFRCPY